ncbi:PaaI family thioesterase [Lutimonas saemankumensis]|uniref:PaaI family thioesterase n=1 Tax=Lutimonas saemankumensis TaxID=483016 RepID=UPI001CD67B2D|nr:PaaI family thioesterase [Lutimonas saemankumensis]MCA0933828.1 PaaI family thioesterase [Lutimonas saemankumensis]
MNPKKVLEKLNTYNKNTLMETLDIKYTEVGENYLVASMPVNDRVHQPMGLLHGGASVALAESVGSAASLHFLDPTKGEVRGIEISANHIRSVRQGMVYAKAKLTHKGRTTLLWEIRITDERDRLISVCKLTCIVLQKD